MTRSSSSPIILGAALAAALFLSAPATQAGELAVTVLRLPSLPPAAPSGEPRPGMLPDGVVVQGRRDIAAAWLAGPTERYRHGVLGDAIEASALAVETRDGKRLTLTLGADSVFEDRLPRLADLDGDGSDEVLVVRSYLERGAALAVAGLRDGRLAILAESEPIGLPHRWLNPVGAADFDGDGTTEIAVVRTPHIGGPLILYRWQGNRLAEAYRAPGFSNHAIGTRELGLSAVLDANRDGTPDIALPDASRRTLRLVSFAGGSFRELARVEHVSPIASAISVGPDEEDPDLTYGVADGSVIGLVLE